MDIYFLFYWVRSKLRGCNNYGIALSDKRTINSNTKIQNVARMHGGGEEGTRHRKAASERPCMLNELKRQKASPHALWNIMSVWKLDLCLSLINAWPQAMPYPGFPSLRRRKCRSNGRMRLLYYYANEHRRECNKYVKKKNTIRRKEIGTSDKKAV